MTAAPLAKLLPGIGAGFVGAYGMFAFLTKDSATKLPKSVTNAEWAVATEKLLQSMPREASTPIALNPGRNW